MRKSLILVVLISMLTGACQSAAATSPTQTAAISAPSDTLAVPSATPQPATPAAQTSSPAASPQPLPQATPTEQVQASPSATLPATATQAAQSETTPGTPPVSSIATSEDPIIVDHTSIALFEQIPEEYLAAAGELRMVYGDRSVGWNIDQYLNCLTASSWVSAPAFCRRDYLPGSNEFTTFNANQTAAGTVGMAIEFSPDPVRYNRANWLFAEISDDWSGYTEKFITEFAPRYLDSKDVLSYQFTYLNVVGGTGIADPATGFFADTPQNFDYADLEAFISLHPDKTFFFWTTSLARGIGSQEATDFNNQMREYVRKNGLILFDVADIEAHTPEGELCYDNRDGVEFCTKKGNCENFPDDGLDILALCREYTTELEGGHLGAVSGGGIQLAKAFWVLMAQIAGWRP